MNLFKELQKNFPEIKEKVCLKEYTTFKIGGPAKYFLKVSDKEKLIMVIKKTIEFKIPFIIIGGGSNILFPSNGYDGLVILYKKEKTTEPLNKKKIDEGKYLIHVDAGLLLSSLIFELKDFSGLEWAIGIPGTLGGAINGNAGAINESISSVIEDVDFLEINKNKVLEKIYKKEDCLFGYRASIFKNNPNLLITGATLNVCKNDEKLINEKIIFNLKNRNTKQPRGFSAGSIFKNYYGKIDEEILLKYRELDNRNFIPAGLLIELAGLKGKKFGGAKISEDHANFIINFNDATSEDVLNLIKIIKKEVKKLFFINLQEEIKILK
jgi:UDP-N-acetylmuramate dehydrogenase